MPKVKRSYWTIPRRDLDEARVADVLDMLRYDGATVESNAPEGRYLFSSEREPTIKRWASFGIRSVREWDSVMWRETGQPFMSELRGWR